MTTPSKAMPQLTLQGSGKRHEMVLEPTAWRCGDLGRLRVVPSW